ncbi:MAG TPA: hypothetical protein VGH44_01485 [Candidatus Saccharimonadia bacterium]|jgi:hypothetical protein
MASLTPETTPEPESTEASIRRGTRQLRLMLAATGLLVVPQVGQFLAVRDLNISGRVSDLTFLFQYAALFFIPTSLIVTAAIAWAVRRRWRHHERLLTLAGINTLIAVNLIWFLVNSCSWSQVFGLALRGCR